MMPFNKTRYAFHVKALLATAAVLAIAACGSGGSGNGGGAYPGSDGTGTTISGKVSLSSSVAGLSKPMMAPMGKPGEPMFKAMKKSSAYVRDLLMAPTMNSGLPNADVYLYNADHPEWLYPVAEAKSDNYGDYTLTTLTNGNLNKEAYTDGDPIPSGKYTLLSYKAAGFDPVLGMTVPNLVAVQVVVNEFNEAVVTGIDLMAQPSDAVPFVLNMFGASKNTDGSQTWGGSTTKLPTNAAIQIVFSMPMSRGSLNNGISISPALAGSWALSADWLTATFYPAEGVSLVPNKTYTVTVKGADQYQDSTVMNVYGNPLLKTASGRFVTEAGPDMDAPAVAVLSPYSTVDVDIATPVQISSNKMLDMNSISVEGIGTKPGVLYVGKDGNGKYLYEFIPHAFLLNASYTFTVNGKGINGIAMSPVTFSFTTAATSPGVDTTLTADEVSMAAGVKDVFAKWIRALNYRNLSYLQSRMTGDYYYEYNTYSGGGGEAGGGSGIDTTHDLNHDGRWSFSEFSAKMVDEVFPRWAGCDTTVAGDIIGTINVNGDEADFEFKLRAPSTNTSNPECLQSVPTSSLYATVQNVNGAWTIVRASEGVDTRNRPVGSYDDATTQLYEVAYSGLFEDATPLPNGGQMGALPNDYTESYKFTWDPVDGATSIALIAVDVRDTSKGFAYVFPASVTSYSTKKNPKQAGGFDVSDRFGLPWRGDEQKFQYTAGGQYYWEVIGFGTVGIDRFRNTETMELLKDVIAVSDLKRFSVAGTYKQLSVIVKSGSTQFPYNDLSQGFDVGSAGSVTLTIITPNDTATTGKITVSEQSYWGNAYVSNQDVSFTDGLGTYTINLHKGSNYVQVNDGKGLLRQFVIKTTGGILPPISISSIIDENGVTLAGNADANYFASDTASKAQITGTITDATVTGINISMWNRFGVYVSKNVSVSGGQFMADFDVYAGDNLFWFSASGANYYYSHADVYTAGGTPWTIPIQITAVDKASRLNSYGYGSDWDASADADNRITVTGVIADKLADGDGLGSYELWTEGGSDSGVMSSDPADDPDVLVDPDTGTFTLTLDMELSHGWNSLNISDSSNHWYSLSIYTVNGKVVVKPSITSVGGVLSDITTWGAASTGECLVSIEGTALEGPVWLYWNAYDGVAFRNENQNIYASYSSGLSVGTGKFSTTVPLLSGADSYNYVYVYDKNWKSVGLSISTSGNCAYAAPVLFVTDVMDDGNNPITPSGGWYGAAASDTVTVTGTLNRPDTTVLLENYKCSSETYVAISDSTENSPGSGTYAWTVAGVKVYSIPDGNNYLYVRGPNTNVSVNITSSNGVRSYPLMKITGVLDALEAAASCWGSTWDTNNSTITSVTISGSTPDVDGTVKYTDPVGTEGSAPIDGSGNFTIGPITVYEGSNNIYINDSKWNGNSVTVNATNGNPRPKFVNITSPVNNATGLTGVKAVTGTISDPVSQGFTPSTVWAYASVPARMAGGWCSSNWYSYTNDSNAEQWGYKPLTYSGGSFSFDVDFGADAACGPSYISVYAYTGSLNHGHTIYVNSAGGTEYYYKPGAVPADDGRTAASRAEIMRWKESIRALTEREQP